MPHIQMRDNESLYVRTLGRGVPVLMLPGLGMNSRHWLPFVLPFAHRYRFYMPDFRGHGRSVKTPLNQADVFQNHAEDVQDLIGHFALADYLLAGVSLGGTTALHLQRASGLKDVRAYLHIDQSPCVLNQPDWSYGLAGQRQSELFEHMHRAQDLLLPHAHCTYFDELPLVVRQQIAAELSAALKLLGASSRSRLMIRNLPVAPRSLVRRLPLMRLADLRAYLHGYSGGGHDYRSSLEWGNTAVTVMIGSRSPLYDGAGQKLVADKAARANVVHFERSGHAPMLDEPWKFMREFGRFLSGAQV